MLQVVDKQCVERCVTSVKARKGKKILSLSLSLHKQHFFPLAELNVSSLGAALCERAVHQLTSEAFPSYTLLITRF